MTKRPFEIVKGKGARGTLPLDFPTFCRETLFIEFTPYQLALAKVLGGSSPETELEREVWGFVGPVEAFQRLIIALRCGRGGGKSTICAAYALWRAMTADLSKASGGAQVAVPIVAPNAKAASVVLQMAVFYATKGLKDCINTKQHDEGRKRMAVTTTSLHLIRPHDGMHVEVRAVVASPGGANLVGYWLPALIFDEEERMRTESEARITADEQISAAMPRMLKDGATVLISTPYDYDSFMHKHVETNWGHPVNGLAAIATTRQLRPDDDALLDRVAQELMRKPDIARRDYECIPTGSEDSYFKASDIDACTIDAPPGHRECVTGGADLGFMSDGSGGTSIARYGGQLWQTWEYLALPRPGERLLPSIVRQMIGDGLIAAGAGLVAADVHEFASLCEDLIPRGIQVARAPTGQDVAGAFGMVRELLRARLLHVLPATAAQLKKVRTKPSGEPRVDRSKDGHCDLVSALIAAVWLDRRFGQLAGGQQERPQAMRGGWTH